MLHFIQTLMGQYGYYVLGIALMLELLALPLPGEVIMTYTGLLIFQGNLNWILSILVAGMGASIGMTISYWIGYKLGTPFFQKYGTKIHFGPDRLKKTSQWFERYGNKLLIIAYYIPGIRHVTGYFSGITRMPFRTFMGYAYTGAFLWTGTFISLGKILGTQWEQYHRTITKYLLIAAIIAAFIFIVIYVFRKYKVQLFEAVIHGLIIIMKLFRTPGRVKFLIIVSVGVFLTFFAVMVGLIQDFVANELSDFDAVTSFIIHAIFDESWKTWMSRFAYLASLPVLLTLSALSLLWVMVKGENRWLEIKFLLVVLVGGELWDEGLRHLFHRIGPKNLIDTFPSEQTLITIIFLGFVAYLFVRHVKSAWIQTSAFFLVLVVSILVGISRIYFNIQYPSDVAAGYVFGGVWLSLNIVLLEIFRFLQDNKKNILQSA